MTGCHYKKWRAHAEAKRWAVLEAKSKRRAKSLPKEKPLPVDMLDTLRAIEAAKRS